MFRTSSTEVQLSLFTAIDSVYKGKTLAIFEDSKSWHNVFREQVTNRIDESIFSVLFNSEKGAPNVSIRVLVAMMILKESTGISDQKLFEDCRFNNLTRSALGLVNADDSIPTESTYYLFRKKIHDYAKSKNKNLY